MAMSHCAGSRTACSSSAKSAYLAVEEVDRIDGGVNILERDLLLELFDDATQLSKAAYGGLHALDDEIVDTSALLDQLQLEDEHLKRRVGQIPHHKQYARESAERDSLR